jgi:glyoxylase-like metal-dependent hydrolase (beta-lactamase superfamily II)
MKMHILTGGRLRTRRSTYFPDAADGETIELPVSCALLRHAKGNVLFDTGCHPSIADDAEPRWGALARLPTPIMSREDNVLSGLKAIGLSPGDIDVVICSHLHTDHSLASRNDDGKRCAYPHTRSALDLGRALLLRGLNDIREQTTPWAHCKASRSST